MVGLVGGTPKFYFYFFYTRCFMSVGLKLRMPHSALSSSGFTFCKQGTAI